MNASDPTTPTKAHAPRYPYCPHCGMRLVLAEPEADDVACRSCDRTVSARLARLAGELVDRMTAAGFGATTREHLLTVADGDRTVAVVDLAELTARIVDYRLRAVCELARAGDITIESIEEVSRE